MRKYKRKPNALLTTREAAKLLRCSTRSVARQCDAGTIKAERLREGNLKSEWRIDLNALRKQFSM